jgi:hypothetical protein
MRNDIDIEDNFIYLHAWHEFLPKLGTLSTSMHGTNYCPEFLCPLIFFINVLIHYCRYILFCLKKKKREEYHVHNKLQIFHKLSDICKLPGPQTLGVTISIFLKHRASILDRMEIVLTDLTVVMLISLIFTSTTY